VGLCTQGSPTWSHHRFTMFGLGAILGDRFHMDLSSRPVLARAAVNVAYLAGCIGAMLLIVLR